MRIKIMIEMKIKSYCLKTTILLLSVLLSGTLCWANGTKPNVLFIAIDDMNDWNGVLKGNPHSKTPHIEKLASKAMVFSNAHCAAPACGPSRSAIMTGIRPSTSGNYVNKNSFTRNPILNYSVLLPEFFQQNGYHVAGTGKLFHGGHFQREVKGRGFDEYYPSKTQDILWFDSHMFSSKPPLGGGHGRLIGALSTRT